MNNKIYFRCCTLTHTAYHLLANIYVFQWSPLGVSTVGVAPQMSVERGGAGNQVPCPRGEGGGGLGLGAPVPSLAEGEKVMYLGTMFGSGLGIYHG